MKNVLIILLIFTLLACGDNSEDPGTCNADNPLSMDWLQDWVEDMQYCSCTISIFQAKYESETVFWQLMTDPLCQTVFSEITVFNCTGEEFITIKSYDELFEFQKKVSGMKIIYQCKRPE
jgi:hypothetical protein